LKWQNKAGLMKRILLFFLFIIAIASESGAQFTRYIVKLKNKGGTPYTFTNPTAYLSQRAIDRRSKYSIAIDSTDLPVTPSYLTQIRNVPNVTVLNVSKWLNSVTIQTSDANAITAINGLPFVQSVNGIAAKIAGNSGLYIDKFQKETSTMLSPAERTEQIFSDYYNYGTNSFNEIHLHNAEFLHNIGLRGQGMRIAMLDGGFFHYTSLPAFDSANTNGQFLDTWDFVARESSVVEDIAHGMFCLSTIAANIPGQFVGKAPKASFYLYRTEDAPTEFLIEEHNWACGAERADSSGADVISTSLGYTTFDSIIVNSVKVANPDDHTYADMNGNTTMGAIAADLAAKKGLLVFVANGNDGGSSWHFLSTPADADSAVAVGAVNTAGTVGSFSSFGPSSDGQIKPDVASVGVNAIIESQSGTITSLSGTSLACPNMAGMSTCLWQGFPEFNNMKIVRAIQQAGSIASMPDNRIGYGIPDMKKAFINLLVDFATSNATINACNVTLNWTSKDVDAMKYEIERKAPGDANYIKIADVSPSTGQILSNHTYQFMNSLVNVSNGTVLYRIRQIIDTSTASFAAAYVDTANVTASGCTATGISDPNANKDFVILLPNPASNEVTLIIQTSYAVANMPIAIYDMKGRLIMKLQKTKGTGKITLDLPIIRLAKGKYIIKVYNKQKTIGTATLLKL
jgi:serine protease AprX